MLSKCLIKSLLLVIAFEKNAYKKSFEVTQSHGNKPEQIQIFFINLLRSSRRLMHLFYAKFQKSLNSKLL